MTFKIRQLDNLDYNLTEAPWSVEEVRNRRLKLILNLVDG